MFGKHRDGVLVVGAGPVGMFTALVLKKLGASVEIVGGRSTRRKRVALTGVTREEVLDRLHLTPPSDG